MENKLMTLLAVMALVLSFSSCNKDDDPDWKKRDITMKVTNLNHMWSTATDLCVSVNETENTLVFHRADETADLKLYAHSSQTTPFEINGLKLVADKESGRYTCHAATTSDRDVTDLSLTVDFNEQCFEVHYTVGNDIRVMSGMPQLFFLGNEMKQVFPKGTPLTDNRSIIQFDMDMSKLNMTATMHLAPIVNTDLVMWFDNLIVRDIPVTVTRDGFTLEAPAPETVSVYRRIDSSAGTETTTDARDSKGYQRFPVTDLKVTINMATGTHETSFKMGRADESTLWSISVKGKKYADSYIK